MRFEPGEIVRISNWSPGGAVTIQHGVESGGDAVGLGVGTHCLVLDYDDSGRRVTSPATKILVDDIICWLSNEYLVRI